MKGDMFPIAEPEEDSDCEETVAAGFKETVGVVAEGSLK